LYKNNKLLIHHVSFSSSSTAKEPLVLKSVKNGVMTLTMNNPKRLNAWTKPMLTQLLKGMKDGMEDPHIKVMRNQ
jgi:enoyl-CoA hydratase/carnithine racemase